MNAVEFKVNSPTSITATAPAATAGTVNVNVTNIAGTSASSSRDHFAYLPTVEAVAPNAGSTAGGETVTVTGSGFALGSTATAFIFGKVKAKSVNCTSSTTCTMTTPAHVAGTVDVKATVNKAAQRDQPGRPLHLQLSQPDEVSGSKALERHADDVQSTRQAVEGKRAQLIRRRTQR